MRYDRSFSEEVKLHNKFHNNRDKRFWRRRTKHYVLPLKLEQERITIEKVKLGSEALKKTCKEILDWIGEECGIVDTWDKSEVYLVLTSGRQLIGCLALLNKENDAVMHPEKIDLNCKAIVQMIWVHESFRGKKLAQVLLKAACISEKVDPFQISFPQSTPSIINLSKKLLNQNSYILIN